MTWTRPTITQIYERVRADMESRVTSKVSIPRVSMLGIMNIVFTGAVHLAYGFLEWLAQQLFLDTSTGIGLQRWGNILGLPQNAASFSTGQVAFTGTAGKVVVAGTVFTNSDGYEYETLLDFTIGTDVSVEATSLLAGKDYNTTDTVFSLSSPDLDIDSDITRVSGFDNGTNLESEEAWTSRLLQRLQNPPASGAKEDYVRWSGSVEGADNTWCFPADEWKGAGTVGVAVSTADLLPVSAQVLGDVETFVDSVKPIPAEVDYFSVETLLVDYVIQLTPNTAELRAAIESNLTDLHLLEAVPGGTTLLSHMRSAIGAAGPDDYAIADIRVAGLSQGVDNLDTVVPQVTKYNSAQFSDL